MDKEILAYLAGYFDGEGCVSMSTTGRRSGIPLLNISVATGDKSAIDLFAATFETRGKVREVKSRSRLTRTKRQMWRWGATGNSAQMVLRALLPYLRAKRELAELVLQMTFLPFGGGNRKVSDAEISLRSAILQKVTAFNNRVTILEN